MQVDSLCQCGSPGANLRMHFRPVHAVHGVCLVAGDNRCVETRAMKPPQFGAGLPIKSTRYIKTDASEPRTVQKDAPEEPWSLPEEQREQPGDFQRHHGEAHGDSWLETDPGEGRSRISRHLTEGFSQRRVMKEAGGGERALRVMT